MSLFLPEGRKRSLGSNPLINSFTDMFCQDVQGNVGPASKLTTQKESSGQASSDASPNLSRYAESQDESISIPDIISTRLSSCNVRTAGCFYPLRLTILVGCLASIENNQPVFAGTGTSVDLFMPFFLPFI
jgi:hypothetical protein